MKYNPHTFQGGLHPETTLRVMPKRDENTVVQIKAANLKPGQYLQSAFESCFWRIDAANSERRQRSLFSVTLEGGHTLRLAEGTIVSALYGPKDILAEIPGEFCAVDLGFSDSQSRRRFKVELKCNGDSEKPKLRSLFGGGKWKQHPNTKSFYFYDELLVFLAKVRRISPFVPILWGHFVRHPYDHYAFKGDTFAHQVFFPMVALDLVGRDSQTYPPAYLAFKGKSTFGFEYRKVEAFTEEKADGPWIFPVFDGHCRQAPDPDRLFFKQRQRFIFLANGTPIAVPNEFMTLDLGEYSLPAKGESTFPDPPPKKRYGRFSRVLELLTEAGTKHEPITDPDTDFQAILTALGRIAALGMSEDEILLKLEDLLEQRSIVAAESVMRAAKK